MNKSTVWVYVFWLVMLVIGIFDPYLSPHFDQGAYYITTTIITTAFLFIWFLADARDTNYVASSGLKILVVALGFIAIPYYLIRNKGIKRFGLSFAKFLGFAVLYSICIFTIGYINV